MIIITQQSFAWQGNSLQACWKTNTTTRSRHGLPYYTCFIILFVYYITCFINYTIYLSCNSSRKPILHFPWEAIRVHQRIFAILLQFSLWGRPPIRFKFGGDAVHIIGNIEIPYFRSISIRLKIENKVSYSIKIRLSRKFGRLVAFYRNCNFHIPINFFITYILDKFI